MASKAPVVILDDDDDLAATSTPARRRKRSRATTPSTAAAGGASPDFLDAFSPSALPRKRSRATPTPSTAAAASAQPDFLDAFSPTPPAPSSSSPDCLDAFCPSPIRPWKERVSVTPKRRVSVTPAPIPLDDDDAPPPPKRRPPVTPTPPIDLDDDDTPTSPYVPEIPPDTAAAAGTGTPGFTTPRKAGPSSAAPASSSTAPAYSSTGRMPTSSGEGASCPISLDSDDELDDLGSREPFGEFTSPCENSTPQTEEEHNKEENAQPIKQTKKKQERKRLSKEEKDKMMEEKNRQLEERKKQKEANKVQQAEQKKLDKQNADWESGKLALESIVAKIDPAIIETGAIGGPLLTRFTEKKLNYQVGCNQMRGSILWKMVRKIAKQPDEVSEVPYILFILQAEQFCNLISSEEFFDHVREVRNLYPTFTICYAINKLMKYMKDSVQSQYKNSSGSNGGSNGRKLPPVEQVLCQLVTHHDGVHSKPCTDEAEVAERVVGLTTSLANCQFRQVASFFFASLCFDCFVWWVLSFRVMWSPWFTKRPSAAKRWGCALTPKRLKREARRRFMVICKAATLVHAQKLLQPYWRKPLTWLSVHAKGMIIPVGFVDKAKLSKDPWFMSLLAIPKVQPRFALAIWKKYGTMRSLLNVYMDPSKTDREKEVLLKDLMCEDALGEENRKVGPVCSKRAYRILMAQDGAVEADEAEKS